MPNIVTLESFAESHEAWHAQLESLRTGPHGPLSITAIHWLDESPRRLPGIPGEWSTTREGLVSVRAEVRDGLFRNGEPLSGESRIGPLKGIDSELLVWGEQRIQVAARGGRIAVRPQDPSSPDRASYTGTATFPADPAWVIAGTFVPTPRDDVEVDSFVPGAQQYYDSPGRAVFIVGGQEVGLTLFGDAHASELRALFADRTGEDLTYPAVRFVPVRREGDAVTIDFNRATNPPCAYSESATCPFPPPENRLSIRIEAGELRPGVSLPA